MILKKDMSAGTTEYDEGMSDASRGVPEPPPFLRGYVGEPQNPRHIAWQETTLYIEREKSNKERMP